MITFKVYIIIFNTIILSQTFGKSAKSSLSLLQVFILVIYLWKSSGIVFKVLKSLKYIHVNIKIFLVYIIMLTVLNIAFGLIWLIFCILIIFFSLFYFLKTKENICQNKLIVCLGYMKIDIQIFN